MSVGKISIEGRGQVLGQTIESMQIESRNIVVAKSEGAAGLKVNNLVRTGYRVFRFQ